MLHIETRNTVSNEAMRSLRKALPNLIQIDLKVMP
jgi:hypothetical protein